MRKLYPLAILVVAFALTSSCARRTSAPQKLSEEMLEVLPVGKIQVDVLQPRLTQRQEQLFRKFQAAIGKDPTWWLNHVKSAPPGQPIAYSPKLGLSQAEYQEFLQGAKELKLSKVGSSTLEITRKYENTYVLRGGAGLSALTGIGIWNKNKVIDTPYGELRTYSAVDPNPEQVLTGPWSGFTWERAEPGSDGISGTLVKLHMGRLVQEDRALLIYSLKQFLPNQPRVDQTIYVTYPLRKL